MAPQAISRRSDIVSSSGTDKGSIILIVLLVVSLTLAIGSGAVMRKVRERRLREAHIRREREKAEREGFETTALYVIDDEASDDMPLGALRGKRGERLDAKLEAMMDHRDSTRSVSAPMLNVNGEAVETTTVPRSASAAPLEMTVGPGLCAPASPRHRVSFTPSIASFVSWSGVARALLKPSRTFSTMSGGTGNASPRLSALMTPSSPGAMLIREELPPPAITVSVPTSASLGAQARAEWEMEMQMHGEPFERYIEYAAVDASEPEPEERDVVDHAQRPSLELPKHF